MTWAAAANLGSYIVVGALVIFTVASVLNQIGPIHLALTKFDRLGILPNYSFFAPTPMVNDYRLVYRIVADDESASEWHELPVCGDARPTRALFNPLKYYNKAFIDGCNFILQEYAALENKRYIQLSDYYIGMLRLIAQLVPAERAGMRIRFAVVSSENPGELRIKQVIFVSMPHELNLAS